MTNFDDAPVRDNLGIADLMAGMQSEDEVATLPDDAPEPTRLTGPTPEMAEAFRAFNDGDIAANAGHLMDPLPPVEDEVSVGALLADRENLSLADYGFQHLTAADVPELEEYGQHFNDFQFKRDDIPFAGVAFQAADFYGVLRSFARMQSGTASREDELLVAKSMVAGHAPESFGQGALNVTKSFFTSIPEFAVGFGAASVTRRGAMKLMGEARREFFQQALEKSRAAAIAATIARGAQVAGTVAAARQVLPNAFSSIVRDLEGGHGAWNLNSARRVFADMELTDDEALLIAALGTQGIAQIMDARGQSVGGLHQGFVEEFIKAGAEQTGGLLTRIPVLSHIAAIEARMMRRIAFGKPKTQALDDLQKVFSDPTAFSTAWGETLEEYAGQMAAEGVVGESFLDGLPKDHMEFAQMLVGASIFGVGGAGARRAVRALTQKLPNASQREAQQDEANAAAIEEAVRSYRPRIEWNSQVIGEDVVVESGMFAGANGVVTQFELAATGEDGEAAPLRAEIVLETGERMWVEQSALRYLSEADLEAFGMEPDAPMEPPAAGEKAETAETAGEGGVAGPASVDPVAGGETAQAAPAASAETADAAAAPAFPPSPAEYQAFVESGEVTEERVDALATRVAAGAEMTPEEVAMYQAAGPRVEQALGAQRAARTAPAAAGAPSLSPAAEARQRARGEVSDAEFAAFQESQEVEPRRAAYMARKLAAGDSLSVRELAMLEYAEPQVQEILGAIRQQTSAELQQQLTRARAGRQVMEPLEMLVEGIQVDYRADGRGGIEWEARPGAGGPSLALGTVELGAQPRVEVIENSPAMEGLDISDRVLQHALRPRVSRTARTTYPKPAVSAEQLARVAGLLQLEGARVLDAPETTAQAEAVQAGLIFQRPIALVSGEALGGRMGMIDVDGTLYVHAETASPLAIAYHELGHALRDRMSEEEFVSTLQRLDAVRPGIIARYRDHWTRMQAGLPEETTPPARFAMKADGTARYDNGERPAGVISSSLPTAVKRTKDPLVRHLVVGMAGLVGKAGAEHESKIVRFVKTLPFVRQKDTSDARALGALRTIAVKNLLALHDMMPEAVRQQARLWYDGAFRLSQDWAARFNLSENQVAAVIAALSPQKDWYMNVGMAERTIQVLQGQLDTPFSAEMAAWGRTLIKNQKTKKFDPRLTEEWIERLEGRTLRELIAEDLQAAARFVRAWSEVYDGTDYSMWHPDGRRLGLATAATGENAKLAWGGYGSIAKAISVVLDGSDENLSDQLGGAHKVRSFYNNIRWPRGDWGDVTIDTHAVAAALLMPLSGKAAEVKANLDGAGVGASKIIGATGLYPFLADVYRQAAAQRGLLPREMQSITWEAVRGLFTADFKQQAENVADVRAIWARYEKGNLSYEQAREAVIERAGGVNLPDWYVPHDAVAGAAGARDSVSAPVPFRGPLRGDDARAAAPGGLRDAGTAGAGSAEGLAGDLGDTAGRAVRFAESRLSVGLTVATDAIPGLSAINAEAKGDGPEAQRARAFIQDVTVDFLAGLLDGTGAKLSLVPNLGMYDGGFEPSVGGTVSFTPESEQRVLTALSHFGRIFNQWSIHVREDVPSSTPLGSRLENGAFVTPAYKFNLSKAAPITDILQALDDAGLKAGNYSPRGVEVYYAPNEEQTLEQFEDAVVALAGRLGGYGPSVDAAAQGLRAYGEGAERTHEYLPPPPASDVRPAHTQSARRVAAYLAGLTDAETGRTRAEDLRVFEQTRGPISAEQVQLQRRIADAYDRLPMNDLARPLVRRAYTALAEELLRQYKALPVRVEVWTGRNENGIPTEPYPNSTAMRRDVQGNNHLWILPTEKNSFGDEGVEYVGHPLLDDSGFADITGRPLLMNDLLRAVHDYIAHNVTDAEFGPKGEEAAWANHMAATPDALARWALTSETRGQNSWVNFRSDLDPATPLRDRSFAPQKVALLPYEFVYTGDPAVDAVLEEQKPAEADLQGSPQVRFATAYHGTPHLFDRFSTDAMGTGEGAQAFGWGLYFADRRGVAEHYRRQLSEGVAFEGNVPEMSQVTRNAAQSELRRVAKLAASAKDMQRILLTRADESERRAKLAVGAEIEPEFRETAEQLRVLAERIGSGEVTVRGDAHVYQVKLTPKESEFLLYDRPLKDQSPTVRAALEQLGVPQLLLDNAAKLNIDVDVETGRDGGAMYHALERKAMDADLPGRADEHVSKTLLAAGVRGIKFMDRASRNEVINNVRDEFKSALRDGSDYYAIQDAIEEGRLSPRVGRFLEALEAEEWLGAYYPLDAIENVLLPNARSSYDLSEELIDAIADLYSDATYNYVIFDGADVEIQARFAGAGDGQRVDIATEEAFTTLAEDHAALMAYAATADGRADLEAIASYEPGLFRKIVDAVQRTLGRFANDSVLGALERVQKATGTRPDKAAAQLALTLAKVYREGFGVPEGEAAAEPVGGSLLDRMRREAARLGVPMVADPGQRPPTGQREVVSGAGMPEVEDPRRAPMAPAASMGDGEQPAAVAPEGSAPPEAPVAPVSALAAGAASEPVQPASAQPAPAASPVAPTRRAVPVGDPTPAAWEGAVPRPDLNNPLGSPETRQILDEADRLRNEQGMPRPRSRAEAKRLALDELQRDYTGTRARIEDKFERGEIIEEWETHAAVRILERLALDALAGREGAMADALEFGNAYREQRSELARRLSTVAATGQSARERVFDMMTMATPSMRRRRARIMREVNGIRRLITPFKSPFATRMDTSFSRDRLRFAKRKHPVGFRFAPGLLDEFGKQVSQDRLDALNRELAKIDAWEAERMKRSAEAVQRLGFNLSTLTAQDLLDPNYGWKITKAIAQSRATKGDKLLEWRYMSMLSGPRTHVRNMSGNVVQLGLEGPLLKTAEAAVNLVLRDPESATFAELAWWYRGFFASLRPAFRNLVNAYRTEGPAFEHDLQMKGVEMGEFGAEFGTRLEYIPGPKIGGKGARALRHISLNTLLAGDEFIKTISATSEAWSLAFRQATSEGLRGMQREQRAAALLQDYGSNIWTQSLYKARAVTFQDTGGVASKKAMTVLNSFVDALDELGETYTRIPIGTLLIPFRKTPVRIAAKALRLTPLQSLMVPVKAVNGAYNGKKHAIVRDLADALIAWGLWFAILELTTPDEDEELPAVTGVRDSNRAMAAMDWQTAPPMSIRVGQKFYDYSGLEPFATSFGMMVAAAEKWHATGDVDALQALLQASADQTKDKTFLRTIGDIMELFEERNSTPDRIAGFARDTLVTPMIPNALRQVARESDDFLRERRTLADGKAAFWLDGIVPTAGDPLAVMTSATPKPARYDAWGQPITRPHARRGGSDTIFRLLNPLRPTGDAAKNAPLDMALRRWNERVERGELPDERVWYPVAPPKTITIDDVSYELTPSEYTRLVRDAGQAAAAELLDDPFLNLEEPTADDIARIKKAVSDARSVVRDQIRAERRELAYTSR